MHAGVGARPIRELHVRNEHLGRSPELRKRRLELSSPVQRHAKRHVRPDETGRIVKPFGDTQCFFSKILRLLHLVQIQMVELKTAERCEAPCVISELPQSSQARA